MENKSQEKKMSKLQLRMLIRDEEQHSSFSMREREYGLPLSLLFSSGMRKNVRKGGRNEDRV